LWPFQLNQYSPPGGTDTSTPWTTSSKRFAWGTQSDAVGITSHTGMDGTQRSGNPHFGYAQFLMLGKHSLGVTDRTVQQVEQETPQFKERRKIRSGIEATNSELKRCHGLAKLRVRRRPRVALSVRLKALALNVKHCMTHLTQAAVPGVGAR